jgi:ribosomal protein L44E
MRAEKDYTLEYCSTCRATTSQRIERVAGGVTRYVCSVCGTKKESYRIVPNP